MILVANAGKQTPALQFLKQHDAPASFTVQLPNAVALILPFLILYHT
jgi:hypothetical protein